MSFAAKVLSHRTLRRRHSIGLIVIAVIVGWVTMWGLTAHKLNQMVAQWVTANTQKNGGLALHFSRKYTNGTPLDIHLHLVDFNAKLPTGHEIAAQEAVIYMNLWDWNSLSSKLRYDVHGVFNELPFTANTLKLGLTIPQIPAEDARDTGLTLWVEAFDLALQTDEQLPFGNNIAELAFETRVMGITPDFTDSESIRAWNDASGVLEFDQFDLRWEPLVISAKGTIGFTPALQPEGAFSGRVEGLDEAINLLVDKGNIDKRQEGLLNASRNILSRPSGVVGGSAPIVPITLQDSGLYLGPVRLANVPALNW